MKIVATRIRNFRLLRKIDLLFSIDPQKPLTVIRAENGSGKTSTLRALRWGLYGQDVLEDINVRLSPADWPENECCEISVEIDFVHTAVSMVGDETMTSQTDYRLKREVNETPSGDNPNRGKERVILFEKKPAGLELIEDTESRLKQMLPREMIDVFFTDGDAAMSFISPQLSENTKRDKVKDAIRSLLGLDLLEGVQKRISNTQSELRKKKKRATTSQELIQIIDKIEEITKNIEKFSEKEKDLKLQLTNIKRDLDKYERALRRALMNGSYKELAHQEESQQKQLNDAIEEEKKLKVEHQELFKEKVLSWELLEPVLQKGYTHLNSLHSKGIIPKASVPVLEERLELNECICGADLSDGTLARVNVYELINQQRKSDIKAEFLSSLYYQAKGEMEASDAEDSKNWIDFYSDLVQRRVVTQKRIRKAKSELDSIKAKIKQIDEDEIEQNQKQIEMLRSSELDKLRELDNTERSLKEETGKLKNLDQLQKTLRNEEEKMKGLDAEQAVLDDLQHVIQNSLKEMQEIYIDKVSDRMNDLFLDMVGADPDQNGVFQQVYINNDYNIIVRTNDNRTLNPDTEVNGASQRALTFAFIWALTEVSGVVAPRVIDTPLGMMSGNVKRRVLEMVSKAAGIDIDRQVVLFLTQSEISYTEDILDRQSGTTFTLIKTDDYPIDLINNPNVERPEIRLCNCTHREFCDQCQRRDHEKFQLSYRAS